MNTTDKGPMIELELKGDRIPVRAFLTASSAVLTILQDLDRLIAGRKSLNWSVADLSFSSALLATAPESRGKLDVSNEVVESCVDGFEEIEARPERPDFFNDPMLTSAKKLPAALSNSVSGVVIRGRFSGGYKEVKVTQHLAANVDAVVGTPETVLGSVEGKLEVISIHNGVFFNIYETLSGNKVHCSCGIDALGEMKKHLGKIVLVSGEVRYNKARRPTSIKAENFRVLGEGRLPSAQDLRGLTAGLDVARSDELRELVRGAIG